MVSYGKNVTGIDNTVFISPKGNARHGPGLKVAIDPPNSVSPHGKTRPSHLTAQQSANRYRARCTTK
jgi:hypothetical protein